MNAPVTLILQDATFSQALQQLGIATGIKYAAFDCYADEKPARHTLSYDKVPLKDVISDLEAKYPMLYMRVSSHYSWGQTRSGIFVFHRDDDPPKE